MFATYEQNHCCFSCDASSDLSSVSNQNIDTLLQCPICFDYLNIAMMTQCSHNCKYLIQLLVSLLMWMYVWVSDIILCSDVSIWRPWEHGCVCFFYVHVSPWALNKIFEHVLLISFVQWLHCNVEKGSSLKWGMGVKYGVDRKSHKLYLTHILHPDISISIPAPSCYIQYILL